MISDIISADWIQDKVRSQFAFEAMCWEKSKIPHDIWCAGDATSNLIETVHADVNREGKSCTLVGGCSRSRFFDAVEMKTLQVTLRQPNFVKDIITLTMKLI